MPMIKINLTKDDELQCASVAFRRTFETPEKVDQSFEKLNTFDDIARNSEAIGAEMAVAKLFGYKDWQPSVNTFKREADIGSKIEIKHTKWESGHLIIKPSDRNEDIAVLVTGKSPAFLVIGWIPVAMAKKPRYKHDKSDSWWVSQINLQPIETLARSIYANAKL
jgi:hypothetical protein